MYLNAVVAPALRGRVGTLDRKNFPNGSFRQGPGFDPAAATMLHFNFNRGHDKRREMAEAGLWLVPPTDALK